MNLTHLFLCFFCYATAEQLTRIKPLENVMMSMHKLLSTNVVKEQLQIQMNLQPKLDLIKTNCGHDMVQLCEIELKRDLEIKYFHPRSHIVMATLRCIEMKYSSLSEQCQSALSTLEFDSSASDSSEQHHHQHRFRQHHHGHRHPHPVVFVTVLIFALYGMFQMVKSLVNGCIRRRRESEAIHYAPIAETY